MEEVHIRYQIQKYIGKIRSQHIFLAQDELAEHEVILNVAIFPNQISPQIWQSCLGYFQRLAEWTRFVKQDFLVPTTDFAELSLTTTSRLQQQILNQDIGITKDSHYVCYSVSDKTNWNFLSEIPPDPLIIARGMLKILSALQWLHQQKIPCGCLSPFHILSSIESPNCWALTQIGIELPMTYSMPDESDIDIYNYHDPRYDLYMLSSLAYYKLTGQKQLPASNEILLSLRKKQVPEILALALEKGLSESKLARWQAADDFYSAIAPLFSDVLTNINPRKFLFYETWTHLTALDNITKFLSGQSQTVMQIWQGNDSACDWIAEKIHEIVGNLSLALVTWRTGFNPNCPLLALESDLPLIGEQNLDTLLGITTPPNWARQYQRQQTHFLRTLLERYCDQGCLIFVPHLEIASSELLDYLKCLVSNLIQHYKNYPTARIFVIATTNITTKESAHKSEEDTNISLDSRSNTKKITAPTQTDQPSNTQTVRDNTSSHKILDAFTNFLQKMQNDIFWQSYVTFQTLDFKDEVTFSECLAHWLGLSKPPEKFASYLRKISGNHFLHTRLAVEIFIQQGWLYYEKDWQIIENLEQCNITSSLEDTIAIWMDGLSQSAREILNVIGILGIPLPLDMFYELVSKDKIIPCIWELLNFALVSSTDAKLTPRHFEVWQFLRKHSRLTPERWRQVCDILSHQTCLPYRYFILAQQAITLNQNKIISLCLPKILQELALCGLENYLLIWWNQNKSLLESENDSNLNILALWDWQLRQTSTALAYYRRLSSKKKSPLVAIRQIQLSMIEQKNEVPGLIKKLKSLCDDTGEIYEAWYYTIKSQWHQEQHQWDDGKKNLHKAITLLENAWQDISDKLVALECYCTWLEYRDNWQWLDNAESRISLGIKWAQQLSQKSYQARFLFMLGKCQFYTGQYALALETLQKSAEFAYQNYDVYLQMSALLEISKIYYWLGCYKKSSNLLNQVVLLAKRDSIKTLRAHYTLAKARLTSISDPNTAEDLFKEAIEVWKRSNQFCPEYLEGLCEWASLTALRSEKIALPLWGQACSILQENYLPLLAIQVNLAKIKLDTITEQPPNLILETCQQTFELINLYHYAMYIGILSYYQGLAYRSIGNIALALESFKTAYQNIETQLANLSQEVRTSAIKMSWVVELQTVISSLTTELPWQQNHPKEEKTRRVLNAMASQYRSEIEAQTQQNQNLLNEQYHYLLEINKKINSEHNLQKLLDLIMDTAITLTKAERGFLILTSTEQNKSFEVARNFEKEDINNPQFQVSHSITESIIRTGIPILSTDALQDERFDGYRSVLELKLHSILAVPLRIKEKVIGALYLDNRFEKAVFTPQHQILLEAFSDQAAIAIENARLLADNIQKQEELQKNKEQIERLNLKLSIANEKLTQRIERREEELQEVRQVLQHNQSELTTRYQYHNLIGQSIAMQEIFRILDKIADKHISVLIYGESGTGKELVARAIHFNGNRRDKNFMSENCAAINDSLLASELFGHVKGAFTGAYVDKKGLFELATSGTLFLDEVGDMSASMQANLLRVLETNVIRRVGGKDEIPIDVRIIAASNKNLTELVSKGIFREDLLFRLKVVEIVIPPLRERKEDIPLLVEHFLQDFAQETKTVPRTIDKKAMAVLRHYNWPGNVRELRNTLYKVVSLNDEPELTAHHFRNLTNNTTVRTVDFFSQEMSIDEYARMFVQNRQGQYNDSQLAKILGFSRKTLWEKRKKWGLFRA